MRLSEKKLTRKPEGHGLSSLRPAVRRRWNDRGAGENAFMLCRRCGALKTSEKWWPVHHFEQSSSPRLTTNLSTTNLPMNFRDSALTRMQEYAGNVIVLRCIPHEAVEVNHDAIQ